MPISLSRLIAAPCPSPMHDVCSSQHDAAAEWRACCADPRQGGDDLHGWPPTHTVDLHHVVARHRCVLGRCGLPAQPVAWRPGAEANAVGRFVFRLPHTGRRVMGMHTRRRLVARGCHMGRRPSCGCSCAVVADRRCDGQLHSYACNGLGVHQGGPMQPSSSHSP